MREFIHFFKLQIKQTKDDIFINQSKYINRMLKKYRMENAKPTVTHMSKITKLTEDEGSKEVDEKLYRGMIGLLFYLTASRPNIMFSVYLCARFQSCLRKSHMKPVKRSR